MTEEEIKNCDVPTDEILEDIRNSQKEIDDYEKISEILYRNRLGIFQRKSFIGMLNSILEYRKKQLQ